MRSENGISRLRRTIILSLTEITGIEEEVMRNYFINCSGNLPIDYEYILKDMCYILNYLELYGSHDARRVASLLEKVKEIASESPKELRDVISILVNYLCSPASAEDFVKWLEDDEPFVRALASKCLVRLYEMGVIGLEPIIRVSKDPSPIVREHLITSLGSIKGEKGKRIALLLSTMLSKERKNSIRTKILEALLRIESES